MFTFATLEDIKNLANKPSQNRGWNGSNGYTMIEADETPWDMSVDKIGEALGFPTSVSVRPQHISRYSANHYYQWTGHNTKPTRTGDYHTLRDQPFFIYVTRPNNNYNNPEETTKFRLTDNLKKVAATAKDLCFLGYNNGTYYNHHNYYSHYYYNQALGNANVALSVELDGKRVFLAMTFEIAEIAFGLTITEDMKLRISNGEEAEFTNWKDLLHDCNAYRGGFYSYSKKIDEFDFTFDTMSSIASRVGMRTPNVGNFLKGVLKQNKKLPEIPLEGIKKTWTRLEPVMNEVMTADPMAFCSYRTLAACSNKSVDGVKISAVFNDMFDKVATKEQFIEAIKKFYCWDDKSDLYSARHRIEESVKRLDVYKEKRKAVLKSQANRAINKIMQDAESLTIDKKKHKLTWAEIEAGNLPLGTFFRKSEQYYILNDNWDLWEEMFKRGFREQALELANEVKGRTTYEKDLMSYFYFVLYGLPEYLKKHTGHKWKGIPKLVNSSEELDPPKEEGGVARKRSALTPIVDNEKKEVIVPYASLAIYGGFGTTYCYSHDYHVLTRGFSFNGYAVTKEVEEKLNGRDEYGLMFYTLTGSVQGRGYPTFLIIFEKRERFEDTRVHFHRTHPCRSKDGDYNPIHNWVRVCYNWMAGNINRERIKAQQGDLFFVQVKTEGSGEELDGATVKGLDFSYKVNQYDNHCFEEPVPFAEYTKAAKSNILGYVNLEKDTLLTHNEHDNVTIPKGTYAIHQCRSWEANPKGVWSLRID